MLNVPVNIIGMDYFIIFIATVKLIILMLSLVMIYYSRKVRKCSCFNLERLQNNQEVVGTSADAKIAIFTIHSIKYNLN
jgi:hypothetical protein